jgi:hypothetical protein
MTELPSKAYRAGYSSAGTPPERRFDLAVAIAFDYHPRARQGHGMPGLMMCPYAVALEHEAQTSAPPMASQNDSARARQASRSAR